MQAYHVLDEALESIADAGPDLRNGMTSHAPMAIEALCALGRSEAVRPWLEAYRAGLLPWPEAREPISRERWRAALGQAERVTDWRAHFDAELAEAPWRDVLERWTARLAPGLCAAATHGVIRVGHAVRALAVETTPPRIQELAAGLASWAATYQVLPAAAAADVAALPPGQAIRQVPIVPESERRFAGTITSSLEALDDFPAFASVIGLARLDGDLDARLSELTETFARVYVANAHDLLTSIVFIHGVTSAAALRLMLPHLGEPTAREALRYAWQAGCGLYAAFGRRVPPQGEIEAPREAAASLIDRAIHNGDEHAIKFTEACLREHGLRASPAYLAAAQHALQVL